ncbi:hybrid sensor histidine kinase/response regulator transcription factor [Pedobacter mendelii]|nr:hybrid sensor histidine kinase/response regulator transcription factor [Pedobacter mendelii]
MSSIFCGVMAQQSQYQFSHLNVSKGLSNNQVTTIFKDSRGFVWFGTAAGINRYDGSKFKSYTHHFNDTTSLDDNYVLNILEGPEGKLWIKTKLGLNIYDPSTEKFSKNLIASLKNISIPATKISDLFKINNWAYAFTVPEMGFYLLNSKHKAIHVYHKNGDATSIISSAISSINGDSKGYIWIMHKNGTLEQFNPVLNRVVSRITILKVPGLAGLNYTIFVDRKDRLWLYCTGIDNGIYLFDANKKVLKHFDKDSAEGRLNSKIVNSITQDDEGLMWIATDHGGITLLNENTLKSHFLVNNEGNSKSLTQNSVLSIYKDNLGIIWAGTYKKGVNYYHKNILKFPSIHHFINDGKSLPYEDVNKFIEDDKGNLWIGTNGGGLIYYNRGLGTFKQYKHNTSDQNSISNDVVVSLYIDHDKKLWIGTYFGGLDCFDGKTFIHNRHSDKDPFSLSDDRVWSIMEDSQKRFWVGTLAGGVNQLDRTTNKFYRYKYQGRNGISSTYASSIVEDKKGNIWIGTSQGINVIQKSGEIVHYIHQEKGAPGLLANTINNLFIDSRGWVWAATAEGLSMLNPATGKFKNFTKEDGLPDNNIRDILEDNSKNMWISTTNGLSNITFSKLQKGIIYRFSNYDEADGLQGLDFNERASYKTSKGELIFGGANGFNLFYPEKITPVNNMPDIVLTDFLLFNKNINPGQLVNNHIILSKSINETKEISLSYNENVFTIEFAALEYFNPEKIKIHYLLEGYDKSWLTTDNKIRKVTYTNLDHGDYTFKIFAINDKGKRGKLLTLHIIVAPPLWKTGWAYALYAMLLAGVLYFMRRRGIDKIKAEFLLKQEREQANSLHELDMMKIKFFTNVSHEFRTPLSLILAPVDKILGQIDDPNHRQQLQLISRNAKRLLNLVNQLLDFRKMEVQELKLHAKNGDIIKFIREVTLSFTDVAEKNNISFVFDSDIELLETKFDHDKIERILFNLLSNAFKFTPQTGHVSVLLSMQTNKSRREKWLEITVIDTGIGIPMEKQEKIFDRFFQHQTPESIVNQGSGIGLSITKEFVKLHNGEMIVKSQVGEGSSFIFRLPIKVRQIINTNGTEVPGEQQCTLAPKTTKQPTLLLVEDHDDFRFFLKDSLKEHFHVIEANNGKQGWQKALALQPDLIVSDISMPEMNGIDLSQKLKNDVRTTHIPVILLTALTGEEQQLRGLSTGAADYLTKPFNLEILLSKLKNILLQQDLMRRTYKKHVAINPGDVEIESPDELFVQKALQVIEKNIGNTEFSVEELSSEMCMSRVTLYKKTLVLTGKSPVDLIRTVRLKRAAQLLSNGYLTVSQVCYKVGFKSQKYFTKSFKAEFDVLPSSYSGIYKEEENLK